MAARIPLIGIDCATQPAKVGIALGAWDGSRVKVQAAELGESRARLARRIAEGLPARGPALLAFDAPLGWPAPLGRALARHRAGEPVGDDAHRLFRRATDRFVRETLGRQPLEVGADRIARTAQAALQLLGEVRKLTGRAIPLAWEPTLAEAAAIEVYPAATLDAHGLRSKGYKARDQGAARAQILAGLRARGMEIDASLEPPLEAHADALDAVVCLLAAADFLAGRALPPTDLVTAEREGWIWVARPATA